MTRNTELYGSANGGEWDTPEYRQRVETDMEELRKEKEAELKCPVCGGKAHTESLGTELWVALCDDRESCMMNGPLRATEEEAAAAFRALRYEPESETEKMPDIAKCKCGGEGILVSTNLAREVICSKCSIHGPYSDSDEGAIGGWNIAMYPSEPEPPTIVLCKCGGKPILYSHQMGHSIICDECGKFEQAGSKNLVVTAWNERMRPSESEPPTQAEPAEQQRTEPELPPEFERLCDHQGSKIGDYKYSLRHGHGKVRRVNSDTIHVVYENGAQNWYQMDGRYNNADVDYADLFHFPPRIIIPPRPKRKVRKVREVWFLVSDDGSFLYKESKEEAERRMKVSPHLWPNPPQRVELEYWVEE